MEADEQTQRLAALHRRAHAAEIRKQVQQKEQDMIQSRRQYFEEGIKLDQEAKERSLSMTVIVIIIIVVLVQCEIIIMMFIIALSSIVSVVFHSGL